MTQSFARMLACLAQHLPVERSRLERVSSVVGTHNVRQQQRREDVGEVHNVGLAHAACARNGIAARRTCFIVGRSVMQGMQVARFKDYF